jgi:hypothetical protein
MTRDEIKSLREWLATWNGEAPKAEPDAYRGPHKVVRLKARGLLRGMLSPEIENHG